MQKIHIVSLLGHKDKVLKSLQKNEVVDIQTLSEAPPKPAPEELGRHEYELAEIKSCISFLEGAAKKKKSFIQTFIPPKQELSEQEFAGVCRETDCGEIMKRCTGLESQLANLKNLKNELNLDLKMLLPWRRLDVSLQDLTCTVKTCLTFGKIKSKQLPAFQGALKELSENTHLEIVDKAREEAHLFIVYLAEESERILDFLSKNPIETVSLPLTVRTPAQEIAHLRNLLKETEQEIRDTMAEAASQARHLDRLKLMHDFTLEKKLSLGVKQKLADTAYTFVIEGWIEKAKFEKLRRELSKVTREFEIFRIEPAKGEKLPVILKNPAVLSPFELITKIYGTPKYEEFDPSIALAFFFALFFGICLGDFGYGVTLALISVYFLKRYRLPEGGKKLFHLLLFGGGVAALVGILTGSYLGFSPKDVPAAILPLKQLLTSIQVIDPIKNPLTMLVLSLALGVVQILFGITLQMAQRIRNREYVSAILDDGLWIFFLGSLVFLIVSNAVSPSTVTIASRMSLGGAVALVLTQGRHKKNIIQKFLSGLLSLYRVSGYMGDTLSYSRLLALGMSTTIIGSVINILAGMVRGGVPVLGVALMLLLLVVGHLFNLVIGTLGAFVHSTRLQMVEFFSKFYEGGGREFRPYKREAEYTVIKY
jgi:V/A-type H+-transporting ATPase subunit I